MGIPINLGGAVSAVGALGTAAFGLVDATKPFTRVNHVGFSRIATTIATLAPGGQPNGLSQSQMIATLQSNWINGADLNNQKAIAKSLLKMNLSSTNAAQIA